MVGGRRERFAGPRGKFAAACHRVRRRLGTSCKMPENPVSEARGAAAFDIRRRGHGSSGDMSGEKQRDAVPVPRRCGHLTVAVCAITRNRRSMFSDMLASFRSMSVPADVTVVFVFVENNGEATVKPVIDEYRAAMPGRDVRFAHEPDLGIPVARNRAIDEALDAGADVVLFVDDDETVADDWLERMIDRYRTTELMLIGGPVRPAFYGPPENRWQLGIRRGIEDRYKDKIDKANARLRNGTQNRITVITSNWLADAVLFTRHRLRFDPNLRFTGGSDTQFFRDAVACGTVTGWCPDAFVYEMQPPERVSARYQYWRAAEQARASLHAKIRKIGKPAALAQFIPLCIARSFGLAATALLIPLLGGRIAVRVARSAGWIAGRTTGFFGAQSSLYRRTTGY
jgi:succinoglycan biosynthesis protein ExoM